VKHYVRITRVRGHETFVPLAHPPGLRRWILARRSDAGGNWKLLLLLVPDWITV
jgi:hypothetical protein